MSADFVTVTVIGILLCFCTLVPSEGLGHSGNNADTSKKHQSPIDIITTGTLPEDAMKTLALEGWNKILGGEYKNTGHTVQFTPGSNQAAYISKGNQIYKVCQFHIHWGAHSNEGSEHLIDHKAYSGELHIVSVKDKLDCGASLEGSDDALVVGVFLRADDTPGPIANTVWQTLSPVPKKYLQIQEVSVQLDRFLPDDRSYYFYEGSLTTSPYNEIVQWHVLKNPVEIPEAYLSQLRTTLDENGKQVLSNFRDVQPLNGRKITTCVNNCIIVDEHT